MSKPILLLDVDDVLVESSRINITRVNAHFGTKYKFEEITTFSYTNMKPEHRQLIFSSECWHDQHLYDGIELTQEHLVTLEKLRHISRVVVCTSPLLGHIHSKYAFLCKHFVERDIIIASDKSIIGGHILVDDGPHNIVDFPGATVVFDRPWNRELTDYPRAHTFSDIYDKVEEILA